MSECTAVRGCADRSGWSVVLVTVLSFLSLALAGCGSGNPTVVQPTSPAPPEKLSQYGLFIGNGATQEPAEGVIPYDLNSALFSDYALKYRFIKLPPGTQATYSDRDAFDFPVGTVIAKTFAYPRDARDPSQGHRLIETRILKREPDGWVGLPYVWNAEQTEATLELAGGTQDAQWIHGDGKPRSNNYIIPNANQCKGCHKAGETVTPIGPKARHLNRDFAYSSGVENQLEHWTRQGALTGAPPSAEAPRLAAWDDPKSGTLDARARAWLEINCAHCHNPEGPARNSGLDLLASQQNPTAYGIYKPPVAAGRGSGGREFDIVPGQPDQSILAFRIASTDGGIMMPELGKRLVHEEGLALVREWIAAMADPGKPSAISRSAQTEAPRGPTAIGQVAKDPVFRGLPSEFRLMESHCGQFEWPPQGWELIATCGAGGKTKTQCLRLKDHPIYAAQFHIEMEGTPESSRRILQNFLSLCLEASRSPIEPNPTARPAPSSQR